MITTLVILQCVDAPDAPVRDNPFQGDPYELSATLDSTGVILEWNKVNSESVTGYRVFRSKRPDSNFVSIGDASKDSISLIDTDYYYDSTYYYKISAMLGYELSGFVDDTVKIKIDEASFCISDNPYVIPDSGSTTPAILVTNCSNPGKFRWTATESYDWLSLTKTSGMTPDSFVVEVDSNLSGATRLGYIEMTANGVDSSPDTVIISQGTIAPILCVVGTDWQAPDTGGVSEIYEVTNCGNDASLNWSATSDSSWITVIPATDTTPGSFTITADSNTTGELRTGEIIITAGGIAGSPQTITVTQGSVQILCVTPSTWTAVETGEISPSINVSNCGEGSSFS
ncbi:MAG: BACON domain-containing carbohydrate-binding protein, partial [Bacteroidota bacterium]|nr:BACON domain-containing carbohydrate-binding protein [Bacteroidota bacterium]